MPIRRPLAVLLKSAPAALLAALFALPAAAEADKTGYSLFNPTPDTLLREMATDRPDQTESPYTVDAGHYQVEVDIWSYTVDRERDGGLDLRTRETAFVPFNFKLGLTNSIDLQIVAEPYRRAVTRDAATHALVDKTSGAGDVTARLKNNMWGNDGGDTAFAIMPFIKIPTAGNGLGNGKVEGGVILPLALSIADGIGLGLMTEADIVRNDANSAYAVTFVNTATIGFDLTDKIGAYTEIAAAKGTARAAKWEASFDAGITYALTDSIQLDAGLNIGLTKAAPDFNPFVGISWRF
jgi:hypothetical protein